MKTKGFIVGLIAVAVLIILIIGFSSRGSRNQITPIAGEGESADVSTAAVFSRSGVIVSVGEKSLKLDAEGVIYTVLVDENAPVKKRIIPKVLSPDQASGQNIIKIENISLADLKPGDKVSVLSQDDIAGQAEFTAKSIDTFEVK